MRIGGLLLCASWLPTLLAQGTKKCISGLTTVEAPSTSGYQIRSGYSCSTVMGGNPPWCQDTTWIGQQFAKIPGTVPMTEVDCHKYHCSAKKECNMCDGKAAGYTLTEPCSCHTIQAQQRAQYPYNCVPNPLRGRGETCVHGYQCSTRFCCPQLKVCLTDSLDGTAMTHSEQWVKDIVKPVTCNTALDGANKHCRGNANGDPNPGFDQTRCGCNNAYMQHFNAETWMPCGTACQCGGNSPCPARNFVSCGTNTAVRALWDPGFGTKMWLAGKIVSKNEAGGTIKVLWDTDSTQSDVLWDLVYAGKHNCARAGQTAPAPGTTAGPAPATTAGPAKTTWVTTGAPPDSTAKSFSTKSTLTVKDCQTAKDMAKNAKEQFRKAFASLYPWLASENVEVILEAIGCRRLNDLARILSSAKLAADYTATVPAGTTVKSTDIRPPDASGFQTALQSELKGSQFENTTLTVANFSTPQIVANPPAGPVCAAASLRAIIPLLVVLFFVLERQILTR